MKTNLASQKLLSEGWTRDQTPPGMKPWNDFEGGWTYRYDTRKDVVFETPCGLLYKRNQLSMSGHMSYMGIEWTEENDNMTVMCPHYSRTQLCELNHPLLERCSAGAHYEKLHFCAVHETDRAWDYEQSGQKIKDDMEKVKEKLWEEFSRQHHGRVCLYQCRFNRTDQTWTAIYDPLQCNTYNCARCVVLDKELSPQKANVIYDVKVTWVKKGVGMLPDEEKASITKGLKFLDHPKSVTVCNSIARVCKDDIQRREEMRRHMDIFLGKVKSVEVMNIRVERKVGRDLLQDLKDVEAGIEVIHASDLEAAQKEAKHQRRVKAAEQRQKKMEKKIISSGYEALDTFEQRRARKILGKEKIAILEEERIPPKQYSFEDYEEVDQ